MRFIGIMNNTTGQPPKYYHDFGDSNVIFFLAIVGKDNLCACKRSVLTEAMNVDDAELSDFVFEESSPTHAIGESPYKESPTIPLPTAAQCIRS
jgi:hypothetical protein